ncbi:WXG superfamily protein probably secreted by type VII secretion system [Scopulibacillus darangshiensis]|uniref:WXG superfamily protein probably secreted by type VII secretion system n=1 Tax=Scopulibacillus darangshiensis TaxID=442528 RepID=A0A4R2P895_9BACL|nr:LXG domain-containing protein [Scopulibacillus darangshiensis]TCP31199.1 WXG superfamily protein probably secreted by type VII secretion system [Scopulibacillus darangshiensis]
MKVLKVSEITEGIDHSIKKKENEKDQILAIRDAMNQVTDLGDSLKGEGGNAIKEYFKVLHIPVILLLNQFLDRYINGLKDIKNSVKEFEDHNGLVREEFIIEDVKKSLDRIEELTHETVGKINDHFMEVSDLVNDQPVTIMPFVKRMDEAEAHNRKTITKLNALDEASMAKLKESENNLDGFNSLVKKFNEWSKNGLILDTGKIHKMEDSVWENEAIQGMIEDVNFSIGEPGTNQLHKYDTLANLARVRNNTTLSKPQICLPKKPKEAGIVFGNGLNTLGLDPNHPIKSGATLLQNGYGGAQVFKQVRIKKMGGSVLKEKYTTARGKDTYRLRLTKPELFGVNKKSYTQYNLINGKPAEVHALINGKVALKDALKFKGISGKLGLLGLGISTVADLSNGLKQDQSGSDITGLIVSDVAVGVASIGASAFAGGQLGALAGAWAGPVGMAAGFLIGAGTSYFLSEVKWFDVDGDGKSDSVGDVIQKGTTKAIEGVKHFFGHLF